MISGNIKGKLQSFFKKRWGMYDYRRGWLKGDCPSCGEHKWGVNITLNRTNCFKCGYNGDPTDSVMDIENLTTRSEAVSYLRAYEGSEDFYEEQYEPYELRSDIVLPPGYKNIKRGTSLLAKSARALVKKRGFDINKVSRKGWGYCTEGKYFGYLIMPFHAEGKLLYFNARRILGSGPKFNNPEIEDFGIGKSMLIYNVDALELYDRIFIFEGLMNAETIGDHAIAMGGKKLSNYQINKLIKSKVEKFIICLDEDAYMEGIELALELVQFKKVKIIKFPPGKDANDIGKRATLKLVSSNNYLSYKEILKKKFEYV